MHALVTSVAMVSISNHGHNSILHQPYVPVFLFLFLLILSRVNFWQYLGNHWAAIVKATKGEPWGNFGANLGQTRMAKPGGNLRTI